MCLALFYANVRIRPGKILVAYCDEFESEFQLTHLMSQMSPKHKAGIFPRRSCQQKVIDFSKNNANHEVN